MPIRVQRRDFNRHHEGQVADNKAELVIRENALHVVDESRLNDNVRSGAARDVIKRGPQRASVVASVLDGEAEGQT